MFDGELAQYPDTSLIWWEICIRAGTGANTGMADTVIDLIRQRTTVPIYVSPLDATPGCNLGDPPASEEVVDYLVAKGSALRGPIMTPLSGNELADSCHASEIGDDIWGADLAEFFDGNFEPGQGSGPFLDVPTTHVFVDDIAWMVDQEITFGCTADGLYYCPDADITRGQMASFIDGAFDLADTTADFFSDDSGSVHEGAINRVAAAEITLGCDPVDATLYCPYEGGDPRADGEFLGAGGSLVGVGRVRLFRG